MTANLSSSSESHSNDHSLNKNCASQTDEGENDS